MNQALGPSTLPPDNWRELLETLETRVADLTADLERVRQRSGPSEVDVQLSCTCKPVGTEPDGSPTDIEVDPQCPAHGLAGHLVSYGRRFVQLDRAIVALLGDRRNPWEHSDEIALDAVRDVLTFGDVLERLGMPRTVGGLEQLIQERNDALEKADGLRAEIGEYAEQVKTARRISDERFVALKAANDDRRDAETTLEDTTSRLVEMTERLAPLIKEARILRARVASLEARLGLMADDREPEEEAQDDPYAG